MQVDEEIGKSSSGLAVVSVQAAGELAKRLELY